MWAMGRVKLHSLLRMNESLIWCELGDEGRMGDSVRDNIESFIWGSGSQIGGSFTGGVVVDVVVEECHQYLKLSLNIQITVLLTINRLEKNKDSNPFLSENDNTTIENTF